MPGLSVVIGTADGGPEFRKCLETVREDVRGLDVEIVVTDGRPDARERVEGDEVWVPVPGADVFALRAAGIGRATGDVVAITEDHCWVRPGWARAVLAAHAAHPDVSVVLGRLENGATQYAIDRGIYAMASQPLVANVSVKRRALGEGTPAAGWFELIFTRDSELAGDVVTDDAICVVHEKSLREEHPLRLMYDNGRVSSGLVRDTLAPTRRLRRLARAVLVMPFELNARTFRRARADPQMRGDVRALGTVPALALMHTAGEIAGLLRGPGKSAARVF